MQTEVYCWANYDFELRQDTTTVVDINGTQLGRDQLEIFAAAWYGLATVSYVSDCDCKFTYCK